MDVICTIAVVYMEPIGSTVEVHSITSLHIGVVEARLKSKTT